MAVKQKGREVEVHIHSLSEEGEGIASLEQEGLQGEVSIPFCVAGDLVKACLKRKRGGVWSADLLHVVKPSPLRLLPRCSHFTSCGGCLFQMLPYEEQARLKIDALKKAFKGLVEPLPLIYPPSLWNYRNKMEYSFTESRLGERFLGLMLKNGRGKAFNLTECHLADPLSPELVQRVRRWWQEGTLTAFRPMLGEGTLRTLTVRTSYSTGDVMVILTVSGRPEDAPLKRDLDGFVGAVQEVTPKASIYLKIHQAIRGEPTRFYEMHLAGPEEIEEKILGLSFKISPAAFFQPNSQQAARLYECAMEMAKLSGDETVWDLYCGTGTIALIASKRARSVVAVELSKEAILNARENAKRNGIENVAFLAGDAACFLEAQQTPPDVLFCDPPRQGLGKEAVASILRMKPKTVIYISCNPKTQAEDVALLIEGGYQLEALQPVDQFPHTLHLETVARLCLR